MPKEKQNYYETLDVSVDASPDEIERAYRLTKKALSDNSMAVYSLFDEGETKRMLEKVEEAFKSLIKRIIDSQNSWIPH